MFEPAIYRVRRDALRQRLDGGVALFLGHEESPMNYADNHYAFRQDSSFLYFWGLDQPGLAAAIDLDDGAETLFGHEPTLDEIVWTGPLPTLADRAARVDVGRTAPIETLGEQVAAWRAAGRTVHVLPQFRADNRWRLARWLGCEPEELDRETSEPLVRAVIALRERKSPEEVGEIEKAIEVSRDMHVLAMEVARPGLLEADVVRRVLACAAERGASLSFPIILSVRGEVLHNHAYGNRMEEGQLVVHDSGVASPIGYASDITRTFPVSGRFDERQKTVYEIVLRAHERALGAIGPGVRFRDLYDGAARDLLEGLRELGIFRGDAAEAVARGAHGLVFQCGCGHMVGLDVHDMEALGEDLVGYDETVRRSDLFGVAYLRLGRAVEPGFVVAVEPGIYFVPAVFERWRAEGRFTEYFDYAALEPYIGFGGVRIEDDVLITEDGAQVLGPPIPKTVAEVEAACGG